jgi:hypothetical protein
MTRPLSRALLALFCLLALIALGCTTWPAAGLTNHIGIPTPWGSIVWDLAVFPSLTQEVTTDAPTSASATLAE